MACVTTTPYGCLITKPDKQQQISLNLSEWDALRAIQDKVSDLWTNPQADVSQYWDLPHGDSKPSNVTVRVGGSSWCGERYVNIRVYVNDNPTKQGVTLSAANWFGVKSGLGFGSEAEMARQVYTGMLGEMGARAAKSKCEGCKRERPSQRDHECTTVTRELLSSIPPVDPYDFIVELAMLSRERGHRLERPLECYTACSTFLRADIEAELCA